MALQPASGVRDLNPQQVQRNQELRETLAGVFRLWGFEEVTPPRIERMDTLKAGGAIDSRDIVRLVADEPLGLRPELTASIARAACTRLQERHRPLGFGVVAPSSSPEWLMKAASASKKSSIAALSCLAVWALKRSWNCSAC